MSETESPGADTRISGLFLPEGDIPDLDLPSALVAAARGQTPAIRAERDTQCRAGVATELAKLRTRCHLPDPHDLVPATRSNPPAIRTERHAAVSRGLPFE